MSNRYAGNAYNEIMKLNKWEMRHMQLYRCCIYIFLKTINTPTQTLLLPT